MSLRIIGPEAEAKLTWGGLLQAFEAGHRLAQPDIKDLFVYRGGDTVLDRATWIDGIGALVKVATIVPGNAQRGLPTINGIVTLYDDVTGELTALVDFHLVTKYKTAGDSLLSASRLARKDSRKFLLVGAGNVARSMVEAYRSIFPDAEFTIWSRSLASAEAMAGPLGLKATADLEAAVAEADVICTCTMATAPLIKGEWLRPGQHLDLIGAYRPDMRELDDAAIARGRLFVDARATTVHHIGEIMAPLKSGAITEGHILADFYDDPALFTRRSDDEITIAKNGGGAHLDLMTADYIVKASA
ncbi:NAD(P)-binding domain-containing protein [Xinfangfangia sp. CPCC 101601]|uniref:NAD(P)-binding domain-containing protein n=1 Tax=Pseudogemmobacter lacusdianii TaxID=3069608 RepID=A0ABU0VZ71_9RHOB|nr:NAD(P)-binding domain-containing protein [Xinfangfangia sp. CPCC 101601]MDQ2066838.1 NAD(P)-binding domain-containing protein [Xinfangfangia sp. CPCC 101601]